MINSKSLCCITFHYGYKAWASPALRGAEISSVTNVIIQVDLSPIISYYYLTPSLYAVWANINCVIRPMGDVGFAIFYSNNSIPLCLETVDEEVG